ncbi:MAG: AlpA family phage regulatory protein [Gammaproteobacteria bacterium]|nr:AlpA family phage regulatory protein [Gammaproteobacteria bacterium]
MSATHHDHQIISIRDCAALLTVSRGTIYNYIKSGNFPAPVRLGPRRVGFRFSDIRAWLDARSEIAGGAK